MSMSAQTLRKNVDSCYEKLHQDIEEKEIIATEMMIAQLLREPIRERQITFPVRLVERESVGSI